MEKIGLIGYGYWGPTLAKAFSAAGNTVSRIADQDERKLTLAKKAYPDVVVSTSAMDVIGDRDLDAVVIALPATEHYHYGKIALQHGKHVLIEKPLTDSSVKALELKELAERLGLVLMVDHHFVYKQAVEQLREGFHSGMIGKPLFFDSTRANLGIFRKDVDVIWDLAPHDISILKYVTEQDPVSVRALGTSQIDKEKTDDAHIYLKYQNDFQAHIHLSWICPRKVRDIYLGGDKGMIHFDDTVPENKNTFYGASFGLEPAGTVQCSAGDPVLLPPDHSNALALVAAAFVKSIATGEKPDSDGSFGISIVKTIEAIRESVARDGSEVYLTEV